jgi:hypothetical protein
MSNKSKFLLTTGMVFGLLVGSSGVNSSEGFRLETLMTSIIQLMDLVLRVSVSEATRNGSSGLGTVV